MSQLIVKCLCGISLTTTTDKAGSIMSCPKCKQQFRVPGEPPLQPVEPDLVGLDCSSLPSPIAPTSLASNPRPSRPRASSSTAVPQYRSSTYAKSQGSSLTSDRALRNTIIGSIVAITTLVVFTASWLAYRHVAPQLAELVDSARADTSSTSEKTTNGVSQTNTPDNSNGMEVSFREDAGIPNDYGPRGVEKMFSNDGGNDSLIRSEAAPLTLERSAVENPSGSNAFKPVLGSSRVLSMPELIEKVEPSIVRVVVTTEEGDGHGSGFVIDDSGLIVTNYHVVEGATSISIESRDGQTTRPLGFMVAEPLRDLCVLKVDPAQFDCTPLAFATQLPSKGETVAAFGSPLGFSFSATNGIVSANRSGAELQRSLSDGAIDGYSLLGYTTDMDWVQTTAAISGGNSGGPLVNMRGEMVGVNTFTSSRGQNLNFAVSQRTVTDVVGRCSANPKPFSDLPKSTEGSISGGALAQIFGVETITKATGAFEKSTSGDGELRVFHGHHDAIVDIAVSDDERFFAIAGLDQKTTVFDQKTGNALYEINLTEMPIQNVQFVAGSKYLTTFRSAGTEPSVVYRDPESGKSEGIGIVFPILKRASVMTVSKDGRSVFACWINGTALVRRYDHFLTTSTSVQIRLFDRPTAGAFSADGKTLLTGSSSGKLSLHKLDGETMRTDSTRKDAHDGKVTCVAAMTDGAKFVTAGEDGAVYLWKSFTKSDRWRYAKLVGDDSDVLSLAVSPNGERIAVGRSNGKVELFSADNNQLIHTYNQHESAVTSIEYFPNSKYFLTGTTSGTVRIMLSR